MASHDSHQADFLLGLLYLFAILGIEAQNYFLIRDAFHRRAEWRRYLERSIRSWWDALRGKSTEQDDFEVEVNREIVKNKLQRLHKKVTVFSNIGALLCINPALKSFAGTSRLNSPWQDLTQLCIVYFVVLTRVLYMKWGVPQNDSWQGIILMAMGVIIATVNPDDEWLFYYYNGILGLPRIALTTGFFNVWLAIGANILYFCCQVLGFWNQSQLNRGLLACVSMEFVTLLGIIGVTILEQTLLRVAIEKSLENRSLSGTLTAMKNMLNLVCDAVCDVDAELRLGEPCPRLTTMLFRSPHKDMKDVSLQEFMIEGDAERLQHELQRATQGDITPGALHVTFLDNLRFKVNVELFFVGFTSVGGARRYLLGLREDVGDSLTALKTFPQVKALPETRRQDGGDSMTALKTFPQVKALPETRRQDSSLAVQGTPQVIGSGLLEEISPADSASEIDKDAHAARASTEDQTSQKALEGEASVASSVDSRSVTNALRPRSPLLVSTMKKTNSYAKDVLLLATCMQWNVPVPLSACCPYHAAIAEIAHSATRLRKRQCMQNFTIKLSSQCRECGAIFSSSNGSHCQVCRKDTVENMTDAISSAAGAPRRPATRGGSAAATGPSKGAQTGDHVML